MSVRTQQLENTNSTGKGWVAVSLICLAHLQWLRAKTLAGRGSEVKRCIIMLHCDYTHKVLLVARSLSHPTTTLLPFINIVHPNPTINRPLTTDFYYLRNRASCDITFVITISCVNPGTHNRRSARLRFHERLLYCHHKYLQTEKAFRQTRLIPFFCNHLTLSRERYGKKITINSWL